MAWSKSTRIKVMLGIDIVFFLVELVVGLVVQSLALMADAFHMLNDIISLFVGLWAVRVARKETTDQYSYGWLRAEILGAFFNAVFLIALCVTIILDAIGRFFDPPEITNPQLILIVGCFGLASNLAGFLVLGGHGHSHGGDDHSHDHDHEDEHENAHAHEHEDGHAPKGDSLSAAEEGRATPAEEGYGREAADESGRPADLLPEAAVARFNGRAAQQARHISFNQADDAQSDTAERGGSRASGGSRGRPRRRTGSVRHGRLTSIEDLNIHPASFRQEIIDASRPQVSEETESSGSDADRPDENPLVDESEPGENTPLIHGNGRHKHDRGSAYGTRRSLSRRGRRDSGLHTLHNHNKPKTPGQTTGHHGHSHGDMGMNAMILHVLGDALGNVGVIVTALVIWLTDWPGRFYADPIVSLFITLIILRSALPLTKASSKILLQATPEHIEVNDVREDLQALPGVVSCHHVHIWQLSDTQVVASMHMQVAFPISEAGGERYMELARRARKCLHAYGIHSATIQPEYCLDAGHAHQAEAAAQFDGSADASARGRQRPADDGLGPPLERRASCRPGADLCLLECVDDCVGKGCCGGTGSPPGSSSSHSAHSAGHDEHDGHSHH